MRINTFDYFRLVAILCIVAIHSYGPWVIDSYPEEVITAVLANSSAMFAFIAGFFFHHVFCKNFNYTDFMIRKIKYVFLPYCFLSFLGYVYFVLIKENPPYVDQLLGHPVATLEDHIIIGTMYLWTGRIIGPYWFIPFIMLLFLVSPIFIKLISLKPHTQILIFFILLCISMVVHRPVDFLSPVHLVIYFLPVYTAGIIFSKNRYIIMKSIEDKSVILAVTVLVLTVAHIHLTGGTGYLMYKEDFFSFEGFDLLNIQKLFMSLFLISILHRFEDKKAPVFNYLAKVSVAIYFLHPWALGAIDKLSILDYFYFLPGGLVFLITVPLVVVICLLITVLLKMILEEKSRFLIGC